MLAKEIEKIIEETYIQADIKTGMNNKMLKKLATTIADRLTLDEEKVYNIIRNLDGKTLTTSNPNAVAQALIEKSKEIIKIGEE